MDYATLEVKLGSATVPLKYEVRTRTDVRALISGTVYPYIPFLAGAKVVVDVGASIGAAALFFAGVYKDATIYSFEPHSESFRVALSNTTPLPSIRLFNVGLHEEEQTIPLFIGEQTYSTSSIHPGAPYNSTTAETIRLRRARDQLRELGIREIDVLKIDTEGCEVPILRDILGCYAPRCIHLEYHSEPDRRTLDAMLAECYILGAGKVARPHIGVLTYVRVDAFPNPTKRDALAVGLKP